MGGMGGEGASVKPINEGSKPASAVGYLEGGMGRSNCSARSRTSEGSSHGLIGSISSWRRLDVGLRN